MATQYSNPRMQATIDNWPTGSYTTTAIFSIETHPTRGQRAVRVTHHPITGKPAAPKKLSFARQARIVDGDDGRTYILEMSIYSGLLYVMRGDMKYQHETVYREDPRYSTLLGFFQA